MSKYFDVPEDEPVSDDWVGEEDNTLKFDIKAVLKKFDKEVSLMTLGQSKIRGGAIYFPKGIAPFKNAEVMFRENPTKENLDNFIAMVSQDLGKASADFLKNLIEESRNGG